MYDIFYDKKRKKWRARVIAQEFLSTEKRKKIYLGSWDTRQEAEKAVMQQTLEFFGFE
jgi:hypothetical protein